MFVTRNQAVGFAQRTRKNLEYVSRARDCNEDVHVVTHLVNSLLGIIVVPEQRYSKKPFWSITLVELHNELGWPEWKITLDEPNQERPKTETLGTLMWHLRNATAHGHFRFFGEPDSRHLSEVGLIVEDKPLGAREFNWRAEITGPELYEFCLRLADHIEESIKYSDGTTAV